MLEHLDHILDVFSKAGGIAGLVILLLFIVVFQYLRDIQQQLNALSMQVEESKNDLAFQIEKTKSCVLKIMYEFNMLQDRRRRTRPIINERRNSPTED